MVKQRQNYASAGFYSSDAFNKCLHMKAKSAAFLIVHYPNLIKKKRLETNASDHVIDIMPTILELAQTSYPKTYKGQVFV